MTRPIARRAVLLSVLVLLALVVLSATAQRDESEREKRERVADILIELGVRDGAHVADIGSGEGFYTFRIAKAVAPSGRAYAVDISEKALQQLRERATTDGVTNIEAILSEVDDPKLPDNTLDAVLIRNAYHEMTEHRTILKAVINSLRRGGQLVVVESIVEKTRSLPRDGQVKEHEIAPEIVEVELRDAGFEIVKRDDKFTTFTNRTSPGGFWLIKARRP